MDEFREKRAQLKSDDWSQRVSFKHNKTVWINCMVGNYTNCWSYNTPLTFIKLSGNKHNIVCKLYMVI
jgi:hypothetical protein